MNGRRWLIERVGAWGHGPDEHTGPLRVRLTLFDRSGAQRNIPPARSLRARNHSPGGFEFGYGGSGPAQLALAIMLDYSDEIVGGENLALELYQAFKWQFISNPVMDRAGDSFEIREEQIEDFVSVAARR